MVLLKSAAGRVDLDDESFLVPVLCRRHRQLLSPHRAPSRERIQTRRIALGLLPSVRGLVPFAAAKARGSSPDDRSPEPRSSEPTPLGKQSMGEPATSLCAIELVLPMF